MRFVSIDVRIGQAGTTAMGAARIQFHRSVAQLTAGDKVRVRRLGANRTVGLDYTQVLYRAALVREGILKAVDESIATGSRLDLLLVDLTPNAFSEIRDSILWHLADAIEHISGSHQGLRCVILMSGLPGKNTASSIRFDQLARLDSGLSLALVPDLGPNRCIESTGVARTEIARAKYRALRAKYVETPEARLRRRRVRRLGRFKRSVPGGSSRFFSDVLYDCAADIQATLLKLWRSTASETNVIVYDARNSAAVREAVEALALSKRLACCDVRDTSTSAVKKYLKAGEACWLVVDAVDTGATVEAHVANLEAQGLSVSPHVAAALSRFGSGKIKKGDLWIHGILGTREDPRDVVEIQDDLGLPYTQEASDLQNGVRALDFYYMADSCGWKDETEVPSTGLPFKRVPDFQAMLIDFGDWLSFLMDGMLTSIGCPTDLFLIHPDEPGASAVSAHLSSRRGENTTVIRVPRTAIERAQLAANDWEAALQPAAIPDDEDEEWRRQLGSVKGASAVITDEFNGSGSTYGSLQALVEYFGLRAICYFPLVDRDSGRVPIGAYRCRRLTLYHWFGPRRLRDARS